MKKRKWPASAFALGAALLLVVSLAAFLLFQGESERKANREEIELVAGRILESSFFPEGFPGGFPEGFPEELQQNSIEIQRDENRISASVNGTGYYAIVNAYLKADRPYAEDLIATKALLLKSVFLPVASPYPGAITREFFCANETRPVQVLSEPDAQAFLLGAGSRRNYGICLPEEIVYNSTYVLVYCEGIGKVFEVKAFARRGYYSGRLLAEALNPEKLCPG
ncbi:MAG: hypothetical protein V1820_04090 [archaeon]